MQIHNDTIAAIATPSGRGGIGIVRISGPEVKTIAQQIVGQTLVPRHAHFLNFQTADQQTIDQGIALYFAAPHSFTGEDILELQGHGGPVVLDLLLQRALALGARLARPGEFSERAFFNNKLDLVQAEAIADLIDATSSQAARAAVRSLQGEFSQQIHALIEALTQLRIYVEAAIDFAEEEIDFLSADHVRTTLLQLLEHVQHIQQQAQQGILLREGINLVIAGRPNAGKSSLFNALSGHDSAIVTPIPGTTRDTVRETIQIDGLLLHITDTAGLRESEDQIELEGMRRTRKAVQDADRILLVIDSTCATITNLDELCLEFFQSTDVKTRLSIVLNKIDLTAQAPSSQILEQVPVIALTAKQGDGIDLLKQHLKENVNFTSNSEGNFSARRRHLAALQQAEAALHRGQQQLVQRAGELLAEDLRQAQTALSTITGAVSADDLLGRIFASFCIGK